MLRQKIDIEKCLISIIWFANCVHILLDVPKVTYLIVCFSQSIVLDLVRNIYESQRKRMLKDYDIHLDNVRAHNSRSSVKCLVATKVRRIPHPVYSPDLASNDFFLFGYQKEKQYIISVETREELISMISLNFGRVPKDHLI
jgi:hypothetical protein